MVADGFLTDVQLFTDLFRIVIADQQIKDFLLPPGQNLFSWLSSSWFLNHSMQDNRLRFHMQRIKILSATSCGTTWAISSIVASFNRLKLLNVLISFFLRTSPTPVDFIQNRLCLGFLTQLAVIADRKAMDFVLHPR